MDPTIFPVLGYSLTSDNQSLVSLKNFALYELRPLLASIDGVAEVSVLGGNDAEFQVIVDPMRLQSLGLSIGCGAALASVNLVSAAGHFEDRSRLFLTLVDDRLRNARISAPSFSNPQEAVSSNSTISPMSASEWPRYGPGSRRTGTTRY